MNNYVTSQVLFQNMWGGYVFVMLNTGLKYKSENIEGCSLQYKKHSSLKNNM